MFAVIVIIVALLIFLVYQKKTNAFCESSKRLDGKTALVTGGTAGMGLEVAAELARRGARVIVASPFPEEGKAALEIIQRAAEGAEALYLPLDLGSLADTRRFAAELLEREPALHLLINNAGVGGPGERTTPDGMSFVMQVNYFGAFLLTLLLLPLLKKSGKPGEPSRIVNLASILHMLGFVDLSKLACKKVRISTTEYYCDSKFCMVLFTRELARRLKGENVVVNSVNPGNVGTRIYEGYHSVYGKLLSWLCYCFFKTPWQGAQTTLHVALDDEAGDVSGEYFANCRRSTAVYRANDDKLASKLWEESLRIVKLT